MADDYAFDGFKPYITVGSRRADASRELAMPSASIAPAPSIPKAVKR
jgi:hypothetical protein